MIPSTTQGQVLGTGAVINVVLGYLPDYVLVRNRNTGQSLEWFRTAGIAGGSAKTVSAGTVSVVTGAASIGPFSSATLGDGFSIPADAQVNVAAQSCDFLCVRSGPGSV